MIICQCQAVSDRAVEAAVADGARTVAAVCKRTEAGQDCGCCIFSVKALMCRLREDEIAALEVDGAAS